MSPLDASIAVTIVAGVGGIIVHHRLWKARKARIHTEANAFGDGADNHN